MEEEEVPPEPEKVEEAEKADTHDDISKEDTPALSRPDPGEDSEEPDGA